MRVDASSLAIFATIALQLSTFNFSLAAPSDKRVSCNGAGHRMVTNAMCCKWFGILDDVQETLFNGGECDLEAREGLRLMFHDAISFSTAKNGPFRGGGADGSILEHADIEAKYAENAGLDDMIYDQRRLAQKHDVSYGDLLHFAGAVGISNCQGAPRLRFQAGRKNLSKPAPDGLIPAPFHSVDQILARMRDAGFSPEELVTLLAAHSLGTQHVTDPTIDGYSFDTTPHVFDTQFFLETSLKGTGFPGNGSNLGEVKSPLPTQFRVQADHALARDPRTSCTWQSYITNHDEMSHQFITVMAKTSTLGQDVSQLIDCSDVIPTPKVLPAPQQNAVYPRGKTRADIDASCPGHPFPSLEHGHHRKRHSTRSLQRLRKTTG